MPAESRGVGAGERVTSETTNTTENSFQPCGVFTGDYNNLCRILKFTKVSKLLSH